MRVSLVDIFLIMEVTSAVEYAYYEFHTSRESWNNANLICRDKGGELLQVTSINEYYQIFSSDPSEEGAWISLTGETVLSRKWSNCYELNVNESSATSIAELDTTEYGCFYIRSDKFDSDRCSDEKDFVCQYIRDTCQYTLYGEQRILLNSSFSVADEHQCQLICTGSSECKAIGYIDQRCWLLGDLGVTGLTFKSEDCNLVITVTASFGLPTDDNDDPNPCIHNTNASFVLPTSFPLTTANPANISNTTTPSSDSLMSLCSDILLNTFLNSSSTQVETNPSSSIPYECPANTVTLTTSVISSHYQPCATVTEVDYSPCSSELVISTLSCDVTSVYDCSPCETSTTSLFSTPNCPWYTRTVSETQVVSLPQTIVVTATNDACSITQSPCQQCNSPETTTAFVTKSESCNLNTPVSPSCTRHTMTVSETLVVSQPQTIVITTTAFATKSESCNLEPSTACPDRLEPVTTIRVTEEVTTCPEPLKYLTLTGDIHTAIVTVTHTLVLPVPECTWITRNVSVKEIQEKVENIKKELGIPSNETGAFKRRFISVQDERTSATSIGYLGIVLFSIPVLIIVATDLPSLIADVKRARSFFQEHRGAAPPQITKA